MPNLGLIDNITPPPAVPLTTEPTLGGVQLPASVSPIGGNAAGVTPGGIPAGNLNGPIAVASPPAEQYQPAPTVADPQSLPGNAGPKQDYTTIIIIVLALALVAGTIWYYYKKD